MPPHPSASIVEFFNTIGGLPTFAKLVANGWDAPKLVLRLKQSLHSVVMAGLVPAIHELLRTACRFPWMPGTRPGMTVKLIMKHLNESEH